VFGKVVEGMDVVDVIEKQATGVKNSFRDVPLKPIIIKKAVLVNNTKTAAAAPVAKPKIKPEIDKNTAKP
jgi:cyclophilin type peptidyl-prolyl cis-trans isomerase/CLD